MFIALRTHNEIVHAIAARRGGASWWRPHPWLGAKNTVFFHCPLGMGSNRSKAQGSTIGEEAVVPKTWATVIARMHTEHAVMGDACDPSVYDRSGMDQAK
jgi:hypothetical protein